MPEGSREFQRQEEPSCIAKLTAGEGAGRGVSAAWHLLETGVGGCRKSCALGVPHLAFLAGHGVVEKHFFAERW